MRSTVFVLITPNKFQAASMSLRANNTGQMVELANTDEHSARLLTEMNKICRTYAIEYRVVDEEDQVTSAVLRENGEILLMQ